MVRDYVFVEDLVRMILLMVDGPTQHRLYNLGSGEGQSISEVLASLRRVTGVDFAVDVRPTPSTFVDKVVLDTSRLIDELGPQQFTQLDAGVAATWQEILENTNV